MRKESQSGLTEKQTNEILGLASAVCDRQITDSQTQRLEELLDSDPAALHCYSQYMLMHAELY